MHLTQITPWRVVLFTTGQTSDTMAALSKLVERAEDAEHPDYGPVFVVTLVIILFMAISILSSIIHFFTTPSARSFIPEWRAQPGARLYRTPRALEEAVPLTQPEPVVVGLSSSNGVSSPRHSKTRRSSAFPRVHSFERIRAMAESSDTRAGSSRHPRPAEQFEEIELTVMKPAHII
ncbi:uncharacterized protein IWZ02DRAFT_228947 [Phyllosticta citriasiana]|uniref:Uncharacterized protein n=1 Tax=Phyllosticta citriasiana TaxID=595635 RepID=A0ABR1KQT2_9PEZI